MCVFFLWLQLLLSYFQFCDFSLNKSCKTYPAHGVTWRQKWWLINLYSFIFPVDILVVVVVAAAVIIIIIIILHERSERSERSEVKRYQKQA
jgi:hypothetical protein